MTLVYSTMAPAQREGVHVVARIERQTVLDLVGYCRLAEIPKYVKPPYGVFHLTLLATANNVDLPSRQYAQPLIITPDNLRLVIQQRRDTKSLVLELNSPQLSQRIDELHKIGRCARHIGPHITLSYNIGNWRPRVRPNFPVVLIGETVSGFQSKDHDVQMWR